MLRRYEYDRFKSSLTGWGAFTRRAVATLSLWVALLGFVPFVFGLPTSAPKAVSMNIRTVTEGGVKWVRSTTEMFAVLPIPLEAYRAILVDVVSYPTYVPHLAAVELFTTPSGIPAMRQRFEVRILGFKFTSILAMTIEPDDTLLPRRWRTYWNFVDSDGTITAISGYWELEDVSEDGQSRVLVRHVNDGLVRKKYPFQTSIMRMVAERELAAAFLTAYHEALRRWPELSNAVKTESAVEVLPSYRTDEGRRD